MHRITYNRQWELLFAAIPFMALVMEDTSFVPLLQIKGALIHHSAYQILVYRFVSCYIGIGKFLSDFTDMRSIHRQVRFLLFCILIVDLFYNIPEFRL